MTTIPPTVVNPHLAKNLQHISLDQQRLTAFCQKYPIQTLALFGSILRADFTSNSDVDMLVEFSPDARVGYFELVRMEAELTDLVGRKVDLRTPQELSIYFRQAVLNEAVMQYVKN